MRCLAGNREIAIDIVRSQRDSNPSVFEKTLQRSGPIPAFIAAWVFARLGFLDAAILCLDEFRLADIDMTRSDFYPHQEENEEIIKYFNHTGFSTVFVRKKESLFHPDDLQYQRSFEHAYAVLVANIKMVRMNSSQDYIPQESESTGKRVTFDTVPTVFYFKKIAYQHEANEDLENQSVNTSR